MTEDAFENLHSTVLLEETVHALAVRPGGIYVDATLGLGGHTEGILEAAEGTQVVGIDQDPAAISLASKRLKKWKSRFKPVKGNFADIRQIAAGQGYPEVDGIVADLGVSSIQLDTAERGFSFRADAPLDMRMDPAPGSKTAADLLETSTEVEIADIIYGFGEERASRKIARWIVEAREKGSPIRTTKQLADLTERALGRKRGDRIHPATRTFQALRIAVNDELGKIESFLIDAVDILKTDGRLAVITFHSLEDRIVKHAFRKLTGKCTCPPRIPACICGAKKVIELVNRKPIVPGEDEQKKNPRSRSAKLRVVQRIADQSQTP
ncbi:MAG: 16S rRNA (cytosine(1402)-N(4))-methyltransferase RsmH [Pyrinomonadaceae bacterium]